MHEAIDGFEHYGTGATGRLNMLAGRYAEVEGFTPEATDPRTGAFGLYATAANANANHVYIRRPFVIAGAKKFCSFSFKVDDLPDFESGIALGQFRTVANGAIVSIMLGTAGQVEIRNGNEAATIVAESDPLAFVPGQHLHVECMAHVNGVAGAAECRINGVTAVSVTGIDFGSTNIGNMVAGKIDNGNYGTGALALDDFRMGNALGGVNDDFIGDKRVFWRSAVADSVPNEWVPDTGVDAFARIDEVPPDGDTSYIESTVPGSVTRVTFEPLPEGVAAISGIAFETYMRKTDAGDASFANNVISDGVPGLGDVIAPGLAYGYVSQQLFDLDPNGDVPWTQASVDALESELEHVGESG